MSNNSRFRILIEINIDSIEKKRRLVKLRGMAHSTSKEFCNFTNKFQEGTSPGP